MNIQCTVISPSRKFRSYGLLRSITKRNATSLSKKFPEPRNYREFYQNWRHIQLDIESEICAERVFILEKNPEMITPSSRDHLLPLMEDHSALIAREHRTEGELSPMTRTPTPLLYALGPAFRMTFRALFSRSLEVQAKQDLRNAVETVHCVFQLHRVTCIQTHQQMRQEFVQNMFVSSALNDHYRRWWFFRSLFGRVGGGSDFGMFRAMCRLVNLRHGLGVNLQRWEGYGIDWTEIWRQALLGSLLTAAVLLKSAGA